jgi:hypothetical protein
VGIRFHIGGKKIPSNVRGRRELWAGGTVGQVDPPGHSKSGPAVTGLSDLI